MQTIMKQDENNVITGKKLYEMLEKGKDNEEFNKFNSKKVISSKFNLI